MSKNVAIKEGSTSKQFGNAKKLRTNLVGGGTADWVPEDEVQLTSLHITEDGEYNANDEGYYGYNPVTVSGIGSATFTAEDGDVLFGEELVGGNEYSLDPEDEEDPVKELPSYIVIEQEPDITDYYDLDPIILMGMKVKAYTNDGSTWKDEEWQDEYIPLEKIAFEPIKADIDKTSKESSATSDLDTNWTQPIKLYDKASYRHLGTYAAWYSDYYAVPLSVSVMLVRANTNNFFQVFFVSDSDISPMGEMFYKSESMDDYAHYDYAVDHGSVTINGKTAYFENINIAYSGGRGNIDRNPDVAVLPAPDANTLWTAVYGNITKSGQQEITVKWDRPEDGRELTDTFDINVQENSAQINETGIEDE